jgi:hypothetical protein
MTHWPLAALFALHALGTGDDPPVRPFAEYEPTGIVLMAAHDLDGASDLKRSIARHLPPGVILVLYGDPSKTKDRHAIVADYVEAAGSDRVYYVTLPKAGQGFWSRDALPIPTVDRDGHLVLADAKYGYGFEPDANLAALFEVRLAAHRHRFEGGNFLANHLGTCFIVDAGTARKVPDDVFRSHYGCRTLTRLRKHGGIGHVDERARFVDARTVLSETPAYDDAFAAHGLRVHHLPRPKDGRLSYVNALVVNGVAFVPQFGDANDGAAADVYRRVGYTVVPLDSATLARKWRGSIHCLSMNYPVPAGGRGTSDLRIR